MKVNREFNWALSDGKSKATCKIVVVRAVEDDIVWADGESMNVGKRTVYDTSMSISVNGENIATGNHLNTEINSKDENNGIYARLGSACLSRLTYEKISSLLAEAVKEAETDMEYMEAKKTEIKKQSKPIKKNGHGWCNKCHSYCYGDCEAQ